MTDARSRNHITTIALTSEAARLRALGSRSDLDYSAPAWIDGRPGVDLELPFKVDSSN